MPTLSILSPPPARDVRAVVAPNGAGLFVIAHRGAWLHAPENSLAAIGRAAELGADMVEIDVRRSGEGTLVLLHDATLERTTGGTGPLAALPLAEARRLRLRRGEGGPEAGLTDERLPTLAEALEEARGRILVNIDTKEPADLGAVLHAVADLGMADEVVVKAAADPGAARMPAEDLPRFGAVPFMPVVEARRGRFASDLDRLSRFPLPMVECHYDDLETLREAKAAHPGLRLWVNTLDCAHSLDFNDSNALRDPEAIWGRLVDVGVSAIQTDRTAELVAWARARGLR